MIRSLMTGSAVLALISAGALGVAQAEDKAANPAVVQQDNATSAQTPVKLVDSKAVLTPDRPTVVSAFMGKSVYSSADPQSDNIGDINDLIIGEDGKITHAVVGVGGFLGIGEKDVAVPFDQLKVVEKDGDIRLIYAATKEQLNAAPALDRTALELLQHPASQQAANSDNAQPAEPATVSGQTASNTEGTKAPSDKQAGPAPAAQAFVDQAAGANLFEIESSKLALKKTQGVQVQQFAQRMIDDHSKIADALKAAVSNANADLKVSDSLDQQHADMQKQLKLADGAKFDQLYIDMQTKGHDEAVALFTAYASGGDNPVLQDFAKNTLPTLRKHQEAIHAIANSPVAASDQTTTTDNAQPAGTVEKPLQPQAAAETPQPNEGPFIGLDKDQVRATTIIGKEIYGPDDKSIGEVSDLVLQDDGKTRSILIDVGGFLGIGEKTVAIPFEKITVAHGADTAAEPKLTVAMTKEQLDKLPEFKTDTAAVAQPIGNSTMPAPGQQASAETTPVQPGPATTGSINKSAANDAVDYHLATQNIPASKLMGATVYGPDNKEIGEIGDVIFDPKGSIKAVEVDVGGFLGIGEKPVAVSLNALNIRTDDNGKIFAMVNATKDQLEKAPTYEKTATQ